MKLYQVRDNVAKTMVGHILRAHHPAAVVRTFNSALGNPDTDLYHHPADYDLLELGEQNDETGEISGHERPITILTGLAASLAKQPASEASSPVLSNHSNR